MTVDHGFRYVEQFAAAFSWYVKESKDFISSVCFKLKNENKHLVSINGQIIGFRFSIREVYFSTY